MPVQQFHLTKRLHRSVIGSGGRIARSIQSRFQVRLRIPPQSHKSTLISIEGDEGAISAAKNAIEEVVGEELAPGSAFGTRHLDIDPREMGRLVGRKGITARRLERDSKCQLTIPRRDSPCRVVTIEGPASGIDKMVSDIESIIGRSVVDATPEAVAAAAGSGKGGAGGAPVMDKPDYSKPINEVLFFPDRDGGDGWNHDRFLQYLDAATETMDICVFTISDNAIRDLIFRKQRQGVKVRIITDNDTIENKGADVEQMAQRGVPCKKDVSPYHMHHKFCVIDSALLLTGSYNWTISASRSNSENIMVMTHKQFVADFQEQFNEMWNDSKEFVDVI